VKRRLLAALVALVLVLVGTVVLLAYARGADARAMAGLRTVQVLVVDQPIPSGTPAGEVSSLLRTELMPVKAAADGRVTDLDALAGRVTTVDLVPGEQLLRSRFAAPEDLRAAGTIDVPAGLQEISVLLDPQRTIGGRLAAGDSVGVYLSQVLKDGTGQTSAVLHRVLVTQVQGAPSAPDAEDDAGTAAGAPAESLLVTLALTSRDAETVVFGMEHGTVWLSLEPEGADTSGTRVLQPDTVYTEVPR
jgi:pilus assembly protein CpaB